jgi:tRNA A-37 threonylcarbamoyl transferase component Bud32
MSIEGRRLGDYRVLRRIGAGGMAEVYAAERRGPGGFRREVALKVLRPHLRDAAAFTARFTREARLAAALRHPNVVPVVDFGVADGLPYLAMELVDGPDLRRGVEAGARLARPLPPRLAVHVALQVARGLAHAHGLTHPDGSALRLVHRDVSPQNILLSRSGEVRLADFGIATAALAEAETAPGSLRGKLAYLAPELLDGGEPDARADIFALAVVLWELLAGRRLFLGASDAETLGRVRRCLVPLPPADPTGDVPPAVWEAMAPALTRTPAERDADASALAARLAAAWPDADRGDAAAALGRWIETVWTRGGRADGGRDDALASTPLDGAPVRPAEATLPAVAADETPSRRMAGQAGRSRRLALAAVVAAGVAAGAAIHLLGPGGAPGPAVRSPGWPSGAGREPALTGSPAAAVSRSARRATMPPTSAIVVTSAPAGAEIEVDGRPAGRTPVRLESVRADRPVVVVLRLDGYRVVERTLAPAAGAATVLDVELEPAFGRLSVDAEPWADVWVDGESWGPTPIFNRRLPAGRRALRLVHPPSGRTAELVVAVAPDGHVRHRARLAPPEAAP